MRQISLAILVLFFAFSFEAMASRMPRKILVSVGDLKENHSQAWKKETCTLVHTIANQVSDTAVNVTCRSFDTRSFMDHDLARLKDDNSYHLRIMRDSDGNIDVDVTNWIRRDPFNLLHPNLASL